MTILRHAFALQLTERCNLACRYCYVRRRHPDPFDCTPDFCRRFVDFVLGQSRGRVKITFFGGEPLLRPDLIRHTVAHAKKASAGSGETAVGFHLVTNATLLDDATGDFIATEGIGLEVSLDGPEAVHDANRISPDGSPSFRRVYGNLLRFVARHPDHPVSIFSVATATDALPWLQALCRGLDAHGFTFNPVRLPRQDDDRHIAGGKSLRQSLRCRIDRHREAFLGGETDVDEAISDQMACLLGDSDAHACEAGTNATITTRTGDIYPCPFFVGHKDQVIGNIAHGFRPERVKPFLDRQRAALRSCRRCGARRVCASSCAFDAYEQTGRVDLPERPVCADTRGYVRRLEDSLVTLASRSPERLSKKILAPVSRAPSPAERLDCAAAPRSFVVRLTGRCNLSCDYCYDRGRRERRQDLDYPNARRIAGHVLQSPAAEPLVCLFGGEPLLNWEVGEFLIAEITRGAERVGKRPLFHLTTNGTLVTPEIARTVARHNITVQVSIDGAKEIHDRHRRHPDGMGSWEAACRGVALLKQADPEARVDAQAVLAPGTVDMVATARHLKQMGLRRVSFLIAGWEERTGLAWSDDDIAALMRAREELFPFFIESALRGHAEVDMGFASLVAAEPEGPRGICECGTGEVHVDTRGRIHRCPQLHAAGHAPIGRCGQRPDEVEPDHPEKRVIREACLSCWAQSRCRGGCMVRNQGCPWLPSRLPPRLEKMWCDLMRAELARAMLAYRMIESRRPRANAAIRAMFGA